MALRRTQGVALGRHGAAPLGRYIGSAVKPPLLSIGSDTVIESTLFQAFPLAATLSALIFVLGFSSAFITAADAAPLLAGVAKVEITAREAGPVNDPLFVKALVVRSQATTAVLITVDAVAIGEIGRIGNDYLGTVRTRLAQELDIPSEHVLINASHCHGVVCADVDEKTVQAVAAALKNLVPVRIGVGTGHEDRIMENRRLKLKSGRTVDVRHAYSLPPDEEIVGAGAIDPQIGILRLDRLDGQPLAVVYNFACHPIQGVPSGGNTADIIGFSSRVIEENLGSGAIALFLQGCGGDINPVAYKSVDYPRSAEPLGNLLGLSTLRAIRQIRCREDDRLVIAGETISLPRVDSSEKIFAMETEQKRLLASLRGTSLNLKTFLALNVKYGLSNEFPSDHAHRYLHEQAAGRGDLRNLDQENRRNLNAYVQNIYLMEELMRLQTNLALLKKHHASLIASGKRDIDVELAALRIGDFILTSFPGELTVEMGLNVKKISPHTPTFVAGYTNGYIYYCPTAAQMENMGYAQEDSDCLLAPQWQAIYEAKVVELLGRL